MKKTNLPYRMYAVAIVKHGLVYGQIYGPYNRIQDAEKALKSIQARKGDQGDHEIIYADTEWVTYIS